ncbi:3-methyladenine DNA glycosylase [Enhygromyxa salina]|uniref:Putative 3-methyladenine DNA glycosylase n=1 Tax=Enhygromyxa salina TaxID=215803 RepID=A0A2S9Y7K3_9BACT|nr:DNA-3-methyladenine glycosylase [Enhygromyxa salina]PRQ01083.1 3-methyladenine DNA glycosylase [Enhygromyxa salina]
MPPLPQSFFRVPVDELAPALLGCRIKRGPVVLAITEVEAYAGPEDTASHARFGRTERNAAMWGPGGRAYVYLCYGVHNMLNVSAGEPGQASAVLIRACEPVAGLDEIRRRRGGKSGVELLAGPGKVGAALELDTSWSGHPLHRSGGLSLLPGDAPRRVLAGSRVGIDFAAPADRDRPWRFAAADTAWVSHAKGLACL